MCAVYVVSKYDWLLLCTHILVCLRVCVCVCGCLCGWQVRLRGCEDVVATVYSSSQQQRGGGGGTALIAIASWHHTNTSCRIGNPRIPLIETLLLPNQHPAATLSLVTDICWCALLDWYQYSVLLLIDLSNSIC